MSGPDPASRTPPSGSPRTAPLDSPPAPAAGLPNALPDAAPDSDAAPGLWRRLVGPSALLRYTGVLALALIAAASAYLLPRGSFRGELPTDASLGSISTQTVKAVKDLVLTDPEATELRREEARRAVRPVYDLDLDAAERARARLAAGLSFAREMLEAEHGSRRGGRSAPDEETRVRLLAPHRGELLKHLQAVIDDAELALLAAEGFTPELERAATALVQGLLADPVAPSRELLLAERQRGIVVRPTGLLGSRFERELLDVEEIPDVASLHAELQRFGQGLADAPGASGRVARLGAALSPDLPPATRRGAALLASRLLAPNLAYSAPETAARQRSARHAVKPVLLQYARGEKIIGDGERIERRHLVVFDAIREQLHAVDLLKVRGGAALFAALLALGVFGLARRTVRQFRPGKRDLLFLAGVLVGSLALVRASLAGLELLRDRVPELSAEGAMLLLPLSAGTLLVRMLRSGESAVAFTLVFFPLASVQLAASEPVLVGLVTAVVAAERLGRREGNFGLLSAALASSLAGALAFGALAFLSGRSTLPETWAHLVAAAAGAGLVSPLVARLAAPIFETVFGYTSEAQLARLASLNHPVLKDLIIRAPGTYHHSLIVGNLAAAAARAVGANALLARVGGYYHDIGKSTHPLLFAENQKGEEGRLDRLSLDEALQVVHRHVEEGVRLGEEAHLPRAVLDILRQHHGTRPAARLYLRACDEADKAGEPAPAADRFRYPGPRPRSREAALVMLSDAVEAAARSLADPTPERLRAAVPRVVGPIVLDGELDGCDLTLADLHQVVATLQDAIVEVVRLSPVEALPFSRSAPRTR